jgi:hypothetical protein
VLPEVLPGVLGPQAVPVAARAAVLVLEWAQPAPRGLDRREAGLRAPVVRLAAVGLIRAEPPVSQAASKVPRPPPGGTEPTGQ